MDGRRKFIQMRNRCQKILSTHTLTASGNLFKCIQRVAVHFNRHILGYQQGFKRGNHMFKPAKKCTKRWHRTQISNESILPNFDFFVFSLLSLSVCDIRKNLNFYKIVNFNCVKRKKILFQRKMFGKMDPSGGNSLIFSSKERVIIQSHNKKTSIYV